MNQSMFDNLEYDIVRKLTCPTHKGKYISQYVLYDYLLEEKEIKDPSEKEQLKIRFLMVLRQLPNLFNHIDVINQNNILYASFDKKEDIPSNDTYLEKEEPQNNMPTEILVIQFIVDENMTKYLYNKDYNGNTVLHNLVIYNDIDRIQKLLNIEKYPRIYDMILDVNQEGQTAIDLISSFRMNNIFMKTLIGILKENQLTIEYLENTVEYHEKEIVQIEKHILSLNMNAYALFIAFCLILCIQLYNHEFTLTYPSMLFKD